MANSFNIVVCIKQVPDPQHFSKITLDPKTKTIKREGIPAVINPLDKNALEEAVKLKEKYGGTITVLSMGPPQAETACREALAMGADRAVLLCDKALAGADTLATAYPLAMAIKRIGSFDIVLCGNETADGSTGQVAPQLAEFLDVPHVTSVRKIVSIDDKKRIFEVEVALEYGYALVRVKLPAVLAVTREINKPRLPSVLSIQKAYKAKIDIWNAEICENKSLIGLSGSPTQVVDVFTPEIKRRKEILKGKPDEVVDKLLERLHELHVL